MRWIFLTLLLLNVLLLALEWSEKLTGGVELSNYHLADGMQRLTLLAEASGAGSQVYSTAVVEGGQECLLLGPMARKDIANQLLDALGVEVIKARVVEQAIAKAPNYWVYLAPFANRGAAIKRQKELHAAKVDSYVITQGALANGISLGVFANIDSARRMLERRKNQGYDVKLTELEKTKYEYWVAIIDEYSRDLDEKVTGVAAGIALSLEKRQIFCKSVASENNLP